MNSPSDDGQYTDTDKEEMASAGEKSDGGEVSSGHSPVSPNKERRSEEESEWGSASNEEDEEVRLRRKLLEKHNAAEAVKVAKNLAPVVSPAVTKKHESRKHVTNVSEDEEMFSMQPKDTVPRQKSVGTKAYEQKTKGPQKYQSDRGRRDRSKESKHRRHREKAREKREAHSENGLRRVESREDRSRHNNARTVVKEFSHMETRVTTTRLHEEKPKARSSHSEVHEDRAPQAKLPKRERSRSPKKRDSDAVNRRSSSREQPVAKKMHTEKHETIVKQEVARTKGHSVVKIERTEREYVMEVDSRDEKHPAVLEYEMKQEEIVSEEEPSSSARDLPFKYSKFDSSPEPEAVGDEHVQISDNESISEQEPSDEDSVKTPGPSDTEADAGLVDIMNLDEDSLAKMSPETKAAIEAEQQRRLIAQLPVYYPGVNGCRSVAEFECLNRIEEGTFGVVYRAKEKRTDEVVALKRLKMEKEKEGFPITSLREINMLLKAGDHPNVVNLREIVVGSNMDKIYLVMEYIEHDMKSLMDFMHARQKHFTIGQVKTLMRQLLSGVEHMHDQWILHRDLKTSNLLLSHKGILKIGDFGLAREFGDPLKAYTPIVVTLWYRSPELLLGVKEYSTSVDMWSCGCIFAEFLRLKPLFPGKGELDQVNKIFLDLGTPNDRIWDGYSSLPGPRKMKFEQHECNQLRKKFPPNVLDESGFELMNRKLLAYDPKKRYSATQALAHPWFKQEPLPTPPDMFPTWPAKSELGKAVPKSPAVKAPVSPKQAHDEKLYRELKVEPPKKEVTGFALKFDAPKFK